MSAEEDSEICVTTSIDIAKHVNSTISSSIVFAKQKATFLFAGVFGLSSYWITNRIHTASLASLELDIGVALVSIGVGAMLMSCVLAGYVIYPKLKGKSSGKLAYAEIAAADQINYRKSYAELAPVSLLAELSQHNHALATIVDKKYANVRRSMIFLVVGLVFLTVGELAKKVFI